MTQRKSAEEKATALRKALEDTGYISIALHNVVKVDIALTQAIEAAELAQMEADCAAHCVLCRSPKRWKPAEKNEPWDSWCHYPLHGAGDLSECAAHYIRSAFEGRARR